MSVCVCWVGGDGRKGKRVGRRRPRGGGRSRESKGAGALERELEWGRGGGRVGRGGAGSREAACDPDKAPPGLRGE